jgi:hypothetical protein
MMSKWHANPKQARWRPIGVIFRPKASVKVTNTPLLVHGWPKPGASASEMHRDRAPGFVCSRKKKKRAAAALLAGAPPRQQALASEMAGYISAQPGYTPHALTIHAADQMRSLVDRADRFQPMQGG